jgi:HAD superfamily hydrolase (TIGR01484 family)
VLCPYSVKKRVKFSEKVTIIFLNNFVVREVIAMENGGLKLVAMDLDGTLTEHKTRIDDACRRALDALSKHYALVIIGAGSCERMFAQTDGYAVDIIGYYGMRFSSVKSGNFTVKRECFAPIDTQSVIRRVTALRAELGYTSYAGETVEFHTSGVVTFPLDGTKASLEEQLLFDPDRTKRRAAYGAVCDAFHDYTVFISEPTSFDLVPKPYNKLRALEEYIESKQIDRSQVVYFGDAYGEGGNDEHIYKSDISFICVDDAGDFPRLAAQLL